MFIPDSVFFYPSWISDHGSNNSNRKGGGKYACLFCCQILLNMYRKKYEPRIVVSFTQKIVTKLSKIWVGDSRSGIWNKPIPDPGVKKAPDPLSRGQKDTGSRIQGSNRHLNLDPVVRKAPDPDPQHWYYEILYIQYT
jgi:hypothetical protein